MKSQTNSIKFLKFDVVCHVDHASLQVQKDFLLLINQLFAFHWQIYACIWLGLDIFYAFQSSVAKSSQKRVVFPIMSAPSKLPERVASRQWSAQTFTEGLKQVSKEVKTEIEDLSAGDDVLRTRLEDIQW